MKQFKVDTAEDVRRGRAEREQRREAYADRSRDSNCLSHARRKHQVDLMVRCQNCLAEYERYQGHHGLCRDCH